MNVDITGNLHGPTVFFLAGWPDTCDVFRDNLMAALAADHRIVGLTLPGYDDDAPFMQSYHAHHDKATASTTLSATTTAAAPLSSRDGALVPLRTRATGHNLCDLVTLLEAAVDVAMSSYNYAPQAMVAHTHDTHGSNNNKSSGGGGEEDAATACAKSTRDTQATTLLQPRRDDELYDLPRHQLPPHYARPVLIAHGCSCLLAYELLLCRPTLFARLVVIGVGGVAPPAARTSPTLAATTRATKAARVQCRQLQQRHALAMRFAVRRGGVDDCSRDVSNKATARQHKGNIRSSSSSSSDGKAPRMSKAAQQQQQQQRAGRQDAQQQQTAQLHVATTTTIATTAAADAAAVAAVVSPVCGERRWWLRWCVTLYHVVVLLCYCVLPLYVARVLLYALTHRVCGRPAYTHAVRVRHDTFVAAAHAKQFAREEYMAHTRCRNGHHHYHNSRGYSSHSCCCCCCCYCGGGSSRHGVQQLCSSSSSCSRAVHEHNAARPRTSCMTHSGVGGGNNNGSAAGGGASVVHAQTSQCALTGWRIVLVPYVRTPTRTQTAATAASHGTHVVLDAAASAVADATTSSSLQPASRQRRSGGNGNVATVVRGYVLAKASPRQSLYAQQQQRRRGGQRRGQLLRYSDAEEACRCYDGSVAVTPLSSTCATRRRAVCANDDNDNDDDDDDDDVPSFVYAVSCKRARQQARSYDDDDGDDDDSSADEQQQQDDGLTMTTMRDEEAGAATALRYVTREVHYRAFFFPPPQLPQPQQQQQRYTGGCNTLTPAAAQCKAGVVVHAQPRMGWLSARYHLSQLLALLLSPRSRTPSRYYKRAAAGAVASNTTTVHLQDKGSAQYASARSDGAEHGNATVVTVAADAATTHTTTTTRRAAPLASQRFAVPLAVPVLFVYGDRRDACALSSCTPAWCDYVARTRRAVDGLSDVVVVRGGGHWCFAEPAHRAAVAQRVRAFVTAPSHNT